MAEKKDTFMGGAVGALIVLIFAAALATMWDEFRSADLPTKLFILACSAVGGSGIYWTLRAMWSDK